MQYQLKPDDVKHIEITEWMRKIAEEIEYSYGSRRMKKTMKLAGYHVCKRYVRRLKKDADIQIRYKKKYKVTTNNNHRKPVFDNVFCRQFDVCAPNQGYVQDITYI
ncbi:hypothetical protein CW735_05055 [Alteromonas sp. MB-3u-76]|nr:hypothetical protein CW735_05055 [Alteromonas sp. MB-3u-76]